MVIYCSFYFAKESSSVIAGKIQEVLKSRNIELEDVLYSNDDHENFVLRFSDEYLHRLNDFDDMENFLNGIWLVAKQIACRKCTVISLAHSVSQEIMF